MALPATKTGLVRSEWIGRQLPQQARAKEHVVRRRVAREVAF